jgi:hypothetical protein
MVSTTNMLNEENDFIGRHSGFEKKTFGYAPPAKGKKKKKNIVDAYGGETTSMSSIKKKFYTF